MSSYNPERKGSDEQDYVPSDEGGIRPLDGDTPREVRRKSSDNFNSIFIKTSGQEQQPQKKTPELVILPRNPRVYSIVSSAQAIVRYLDKRHLEVQGNEAVALASSISYSKNVVQRDDLESLLKEMINGGPLYSTILNGELIRPLPIRLIDYGEETVLKDINEVSDFQLYMNKARRYRRLTPQEEFYFLVETKKANPDRIEQAIEVLVNANLRLVVPVARRYVRRGVPFMDLIQAGNQGLMRAIEKYDPTFINKETRRPSRLSTVAAWWIRQEITRTIADTRHTVRLPVHFQEREAMVYKFIDLYFEEKGRKPSNVEVARGLGLKVYQVEEALQNTVTVSMQTPVGPDATLEDFVARTPQNPHPEIEQAGLKQVIDEVLSDLQGKEEEVIRMRFGLNEKSLPRDSYRTTKGRGMTLDEVGLHFGLTRERIRQIENVALRRLRHPSRSNRLRDYYENDPDEQK